MLTHREAKYVAARINGATKQDSAIKAGFSPWLARIPGHFIENDDVVKAIEEAQAVLVQHTLAESLIDATEIHEYLTDALRARMSDVRNDDHSFKPRSEWPEIWDRMEEGGDVEVRYESSRSHDGETKDKAGGWDKTGATVVSVKLKFASRTKLLELAMRHKGVNAMVEPGAKLGAGLSDLANAINLKTVVDLASVCSIEQLEQLRQRALESQNVLPVSPVASEALQKDVDLA